MARDAHDQLPATFETNLEFSDPKTGAKSLQLPKKEQQEGSAACTGRRRASELTFDESDFRPRWWPPAGAQ